MDDVRYPLGRFQPPRNVTAELRDTWVEQFAQAPAKLRAAVDGLDADQLQTTYREGGWTVAQVVHHLCDSHMNAYIRFKLALTEEVPTVKGYDESAWATLPDASSTAGLDVSLRLLEALHERALAMLRAMGPDAWGRQYVHEEAGLRTLDLTLAIYAWHGRHHVAHITKLRERMGW
ncbi:MAG: YfiT family bacillithiol transferase [Vicinamibacterales bacterium]